MTPAPPVPALGFDMSGHQYAEQVAAQLANPDFAFAIIKATEGQTGVNSRFDQQAPLLKASPLRRGWYHFGWQNQDGATEARHFWATIEPYVQAGDALFCDVENWDQEHKYAAMAGVTWAQRFDYYIEFRDELERLSGSVGNIYPLWTVIKAFREQCGMTSANGWQPTPAWTDLTRAGLWLPQYYIGSGDARHAVKPGEYDSVSGGWPVFVHQWTSSPFDKNWTPDLALWDEHAI